MLVYSRLASIFFCFIFAIYLPSYSLFANATPLKVLNYQKNEVLVSHLLPQNHPVRPYLKSLFDHPHLFKSVRSFESAGFKVKSGHRGLMVGFHPSIPRYLFKKFSDHRSQSGQLENFIKRLEGARILREYIQKHNFKHLVVPQKWLYQLPKSFSKKYGSPSYVLIVENMDIYDWDDPNGEAKRLYYNMDREMLTELCTLLHAVGGCDAYPRNQPFTHYGKIAFVDTEHIGQLKNHFLKHIVPALNEELQIYARELWRKLEEKE